MSWCGAAATTFRAPARRPFRHSSSVRLDARDHAIGEVPLACCRTPLRSCGHGPGTCLGTHCYTPDGRCPARIKLPDLPAPASVFLLDALERRSASSLYAGPACGGRAVDQCACRRRRASLMRQAPRPAARWAASREGRAGRCRSLRPGPRLVRCRGGRRARAVRVSGPGSRMP